jgi:hypothetical protein
MELEQPYLKVASALRLKLLQEDVLPEIWQKFRDPLLHSALLLLAQYWDDEADDAVHARLLHSELKTPDLEAYYASSEQDLPDRINRSQVDPEQDFFKLDFVSGWDSHVSSIPAFACYCWEGVGQHLNERDQFAPYAVFRKKPELIEMTVVGKKYQPWKEGIRADWGNLFQENTPQNLSQWYYSFLKQWHFPIEMGYQRPWEKKRHLVQVIGLEDLHKSKKAGVILVKTDQGGKGYPLNSLKWADEKDASLFHRYNVWQSRQYLLLKPIPDFSHWRFEKE